MHNDQKVALTFALYNGSSLIRKQTVSEDIIKLGSGPTANVRLADAKVAGMHAVIEAQATDDVTLIDLGNQPATTVNGASINKCQLAAGDEIMLGDTRLVVEAVEHAATRRVATAKPYAGAAAKANPFLSQNPFTAPAFDAVAKADAPEGTYEYRLVQGQAVSPSDVDTDTDGAEVKISWGTNVLHVEHVKTSGSFYAGETDEKNLRCDYFIPAQKLGTARAPLFIAGRAVLLPGRAATITLPNQPAMSVQEAVAAGIATPCAEVAGALQVALAPEMTVKLMLDDVVVEVRGVKRARKVAAAFTMAAVAGGAMLYVLGSLIGHAGLLAAMAAFMPPLGATADDELTDDQRYMVQQYLDAAAEIERQEPEKEVLTELADGNPGGTGTAAKGSSGKMGSETSTNADGRFAIQGNNPQPYIAKQEALREAAEFGMIGLLNDGMGSKNAPVADWGQLTADGADPLSADGNMWGSKIGDAYGPGGLGLTGVGEGGDGLGEGIGLGTIGTIGHGDGNGCLGCQGIGDGFSDGFLRRRTHTANAPNPVRQGVTKTNGRLPPEVIQRVVRANFGRYRACYQGALSANPNLQGRVVVSFVIGRSGTVSTAQAGGDLPNAGVMGCVASAFRSLTFPAPADGIVTVSYPLVFSPTN